MKHPRHPPIRRRCTCTSLPPQAAVEASQRLPRPPRPSTTRRRPFASPPVLTGTLDVATLVAKLKPAVVNVTVVHEVHRPRMEGMPFLGRFFGPNGGGGMQGPNRDEGGGDEVLKQQGLGTGFIIDAEGHILTNAHVVDGADQVRVKLDDEREFEAKVKGKDERLDVAVLEIIGKVNGLPYVSLGSSDQLRVGESVVAIGNPFGLGNTVTTGIVSAKSRTIGAGPYDDFIQTDAAINPGNSGGPLFNTRGQVIGINTAINPNGTGIGFAIPIDLVQDVVPQLLATGHVSRGKLGVVIQPGRCGHGESDRPRPKRAARWSAKSRPAARARRRVCKPATCW